MAKTKQKTPTFKPRPVVQKRLQRKTVTQNNVGKCLQNPGLIRLARRGGVKRLSKPVREEMNEMMNEFLEKIVGDAGIYRDSGKRKTLSLKDVEASLTLNNVKTAGL